jgi:hypothetical protein
MERSRRTPAAVATVASAVLIASMFLDWYRLDLPARLRRPGTEVPSYDAFEGLERADVALVVAAAVALLLAAVMFAGLLARSAAPALALLAAGVLALAIVLYRGINRPPQLICGGEFDTTLRLGGLVAPAAAAVVSLAGVLTYLAGPRIELALEDDESPPPGGREEPGS